MNINSLTPWTGSLELLCLQTSTHLLVLFANHNCRAILGVYVTAFYHSDTVIVGLNSTRRMHVSVLLLCLCCPV
jgi:hypothetical protein